MRIMKEEIKINKENIKFKIINMIINLIIKIKKFIKLLDNSNIKHKYLKIINKISFSNRFNQKINKKISSNRINLNKNNKQMNQKINSKIMNQFLYNKMNYKMNNLKNYLTQFKMNLKKKTNNLQLQKDPLKKKETLKCTLILQSQTQTSLKIFKK